MFVLACGNNTGYAVDVSTAALASVKTYETEIVRVFHACYEPLLCSSKVCDYKSGIMTLVAAKDCASAALAPGGTSYPVTVANYLAQALKQPNAVA